MNPADAPSELRKIPFTAEQWSKVTVTEAGCWQWLKPNQPGYGRAVVDGVKRRLHRWSYELLVGPIPDGLQIDHLCRNRACFNPAHLEPVTPQVNSLRGETVAAANAAKTECKHGHKFTPENTYWRLDGRGRQCRACSVENKRSRAA